MPSLCVNKQIGDKPNIQLLPSIPGNFAIWLHLQRVLSRLAKKIIFFASLLRITQMCDVSLPI
jgi:hypothetical protein